MTKRFNGLKIAITLAIGLLLLGAPVQAAYQLTLTDGVTTVTCTSGVLGGAPCAQPSGDGGGAMVYTGAVGTNFTVNVTTGLTKGVLSAPDLMDLSTVNVATTGAGTLTITWSDQNWPFDVPPLGFRMLAGGTNTAPPGSTVKYEAFADDTNALSTTVAADLIGTLGPFGVGAFGGTLDAFAPAVSNPYSLTQRLTLSFTGSGIMSGDFQLNIVPEPASVALLGGALLLTCGALKRRFRRS